MFVDRFVHLSELFYVLAWAYIVFGKGKGDVLAGIILGVFAVALGLWGI